MSPVSFLQSEQADPYALYRVMRMQAPVYYDCAQSLWGVYTYAHCEAVLKHHAAVIPRGTQFFVGLSYEADQIGRHLARVSNGAAHDSSRQAAYALLARWQPPDVGRLLLSLLDHSSGGIEIDWVERVSMVLPSLALLEGLGFSRDVAMMITQVLPDLVRIMLPVKTPADAQAINQAVAQVLPSVSAYIRRHGIGKGSEAEILYLSNLLGVFIQSHEAGRGLLCHALLQTFRQPIFSRSYAACLPFVRETLRFDSPIHHTRRELAADMMLGNITIPAGATVLVMLASANRDEQYFSAPDVFDPARERTTSYLSFGAGAHLCLAEHFSIDLAATALHTLYSHYTHVHLLEQEIRYAPKANARLPVRMRLALD
jgi:cytochrome P450